MTTRLSWPDALGRVLLCLVFLNSVLGKLSGYGEVSALLRARGLPLPDLVPAASMALMGVGSLLVISGWRQRLGAVLLLVFLIPATLVFHTAVEDPQQRIQLFKNLAIMGGLLLVIDRGRQSDPRSRR